MSATNGFWVTGVVNGNPEVKTFGSGGSVVSVLINCQIQKFTGGGIEIDYTDYQVKGFGKIGERLAQLVNGSTVSISGNIDARTWKSRDTGKDGVSVELVARDIAVLSDAAGGDAF